MRENEILYTMGLNRIDGIGLINAKRLIEYAGSATALFEQPDLLYDKNVGIPERIIKALRSDRNWMDDCRRELDFVENNGIQCLLYHDADYPSRLRECNDAPIILYFKGNSNLNSLHILNIVGTRQATSYGTGICQTFVKELSELCPDTLIISGLAYGIDIAAHRAALDNGLPTIGVLAHGLDRLYPSVHRQTAVRMSQQGGLLTEFPTGTNPDRQNFLQRNRIVAGMADATIVVESASHGGALVTADLAFGYNRDCFAFPGRSIDKYSEGCNRLIATNKAQLILSASDFVKAIRWDTPMHLPPATQRELFPELTPDETTIVSLLQENQEGIQLNTLALESGYPIPRLTGILFDLEFKGLIRLQAGGVYQLIC